MPLLCLYLCLNYAFKWLYYKLPSSLTPASPIASATSLIASLTTSRITLLTNSVAALLTILLIALLTTSLTTLLTTSLANVTA